MECIGASKIVQRFGRLLLKSNACLNSQTLLSTTTTTSIQRSNVERDNNKSSTGEGHKANGIYQASYARLAFSTFVIATATAAATDRPVYPHFIHLENHTVNQQTFTRHSRHYCTVKTNRKKMVRFLFGTNF